MLKRYPSLQAMRAFLQAARAGSFSRAARELDLTHSAISQQIRTLEDYVGQALFVREGGGVVLTDAGQRFASVLADGVAQMERALLAVRTEPAARTLTIDIDAELAQAWLNARLPALLAALPDCVPVFMSTPRAERPSFERVDVSLRYGYGEWIDCEMALVSGDRLTVVASPALLAARGMTRPLAPARVLELPLLAYTRRSWSPWLEAAGLEPAEPRAVASFDNAANLVAAAEAGLGAGLGRGLLVADALRAGRLVAVTEVVIPTHYNLYAVWPRGQGARAQPVLDAVRTLVAATVSPAG
ncbi:LysR family transcriptional regulator [Crenobacter luteus]|uniref:LysR family transcriptional regulator n=1 Tax=Crenobacter luteus TaxID=1452487 RepID=A0A161RB79_9NEIS|nr:LysR family transcriptional regulator [Crenobacter luteus]KZE34348.1 LysR family transcriptional regulator [Crenobacter luteus]